jgi:ATP-binding cassette subfamily B protein
MQYLGLYSRVLTLLKPEQRLTWFLCSASFLLSLFILSQILLFGWILYALTQNQSVLTLILIFTALALMAAGMQMWITQHAGKLAHRRRFAAIRDFFEQALSQDAALGAFSTHGQNAGPEIQTMLRGSDQIYFIILSFFRDHLSAACSLVVALLMAFWLSWPMALLLLAQLVLFSALNIFLVGRTLKNQGESEKIHAALAARAADVMNNALIIQTYTRLEAETRGLDENIQSLLSTQYPVLDWWARKSAIFNACLAITLISIMALGSYLHGEAQLGLFEIISFSGFGLLLLNYANRLTDFANQLLFRKKTLSDFFTLLDAKAIIKEKPDARVLSLRQGQIEFRDISVPGEPGLQDFNLTIAPDEKVAIIDSSGRSAAFIGSLLLRKLDPQSGNILIDNQDIANITLASLHQAIGLVTERSGLLNRTIMENLNLGKANATQEEVIEAVTKAEAHEFIGATVDGFHTLLHEYTLSASEQERLNIARAILKDAPILVFEERSIDGEESSSAIDAMLESRTTLLFPRRLATLQKTDRIVVLNNGEIAESGSYDELTQKKGALAKLISEGHFLSQKIAKLLDQQKRRSAAATGE